MSIPIAIDHFQKALDDIDDPQDDPVMWNLCSGLLKLSQGLHQMNSTVTTTSMDTTEISEILQIVQTLRDR